MSIHDESVLLIYVVEYNMQVFHDCWDVVHQDVD